MSYTLTPKQLESFEQDGFLLLDDLFTPDQTKDIQSWTAEVKAWPNRPGQHMPYDEERADGTTGLCRTESELTSYPTNADYANFHPGFGSLFRGERLTGVLAQLMGEQAVLFKEKVGRTEVSLIQINYKEAGGSGGFDAHIDAK